jgi:hypothetical protein
MERSEMMYQTYMMESELLELQQRENEGCLLDESVRGFFAKDFVKSIKNNSITYRKIFEKLEIHTQFIAEHKEEIASIKKPFTCLMYDKGDAFMKVSDHAVADLIKKSSEILSTIVKTNSQEALDKLKGELTRQKITMKLLGAADFGAFDFVLSEYVLANGQVAKIFGKRVETEVTPSDVKRFAPYISNCMSEIKKDAVLVESHCDLISETISKLDNGGKLDKQKVKLISMMSKMTLSVALAMAQVKPQYSGVLMYVIKQGIKKNK